MSQPSVASIKSPPLGRLLVVQCVALVLVSLVLRWFNATIAYSVLLGGLVFIIPQSYLAYSAFRFTGARATRAVVRAFYWGEAGKFILTVLLFAVIFIGVKQIHLVAFFIAYIAMWVGFLVGVRHILAD